MHGLGNDFMVIDATRQAPPLTPEVIKHWARRRHGVGFDQLLLAQPADRAGVDFRYRVYNADGGEVEQCGNGARCLALFVRRRGLTDKEVITVGTSGGEMVLRVLAGGEVEVDMGRPCFEPEALPFLAARRERYTLEVAGQALEVGAVSVQNPHVATLVEDVERAPVARVGAALQAHALFPRRVNAGLMQVLDRGHIKLRVYERGAGETPACGSGACAAVVIGRAWEMLADTVEVGLPGGALRVRWPGGDAPVSLIGPAEHVYDGVVVA